MFHYRCFAAFSGVGWFQFVTDGCRSLESRPTVSDGFELLQTVAKSRMKIFCQKIPF
jgi:hypothetical protein